VGKLASVGSTRSVDRWVLVTVGWGGYAAVVVVRAVCWRVVGTVAINQATARDVQSTLTAARQHCQCDSGPDRRLLQRSVSRCSTHCRAAHHMS
jgi:hypothetical protein